VLAALALVVGVAIVAAILGTGPSACQPPAGAPAGVPAPGTNGGELRGRVSWFGGPRDASTGPTTASGLPVTRPGIAVYNTQTLRGYWWVRFPNGRAAILEQTDIGPAPWTGRVLDVLYSALPALGYSEQGFPTDGQIVAAYLGRDARWATSAVGSQRDLAGLPPGAAPDSNFACGESGLEGTGVPGKVRVAPGANRPGVPLQQLTLDYVAQMAGLAGRQLVISTGTNHSAYTVDGAISDHWDGYAADLGMAANSGTDGGPVGDTLMQACLQLAGQPAAEAARNARSGGLYTLHRDGVRIQCIWKTYAGGNHFNHVHVGLRPQ
jgi:hypothetical protein